jgi:hypothetical protein
MASPARSTSVQRSAKDLAPAPPGEIGEQVTSITIEVSLPIAEPDQVLN